MTLNNDQAEAIVKAIVMNAVDDYTTSAMKVRHRFNPPFRGENLQRRALGCVRQALIDGQAAEHFILSPDFTALTGLDGEMVVEGLAKQNFVQPGYFNTMQKKFDSIYGRGSA